MCTSVPTPYTYLFRRGGVGADVHKLLKTIPKSGGNGNVTWTKFTVAIVLRITFEHDFGISVL